MVKFPATFPPQNVPLVDAAGLMNSVWRTALMVPMYQRTGGAAGSSTADIQDEVTALQNNQTSTQKTAQLAFTDAQIALTQIEVVNTTISGISTVANSASTTAESLFANALLKSNNLADVGSIPIAQRNLSVNITPTGASSLRPAAPANGQTFFDTSIHQAIWFIGGNWVNAVGAAV